jgi:CRP/FNR family cyclic AMP-dependent transcriptional regulator
MDEKARSPSPARDRARPLGRRILSAAQTTKLRTGHAFQRHFEDGEIIFEEGDEGVDLYVIQSGHVQVTRRGGQRERVVAKLGPGEFFGEMSVVLAESRTARAVAIGSTALLELDGETLEAMCIERPEIAIRMIQRLAIRLIAAERRLAALGLDELVGPLVRHLATLSDDSGSGELRLTTTLRELATGCALSMQETHQALHQLMDQQLIRLVGDELVAPDRVALGDAMTRFAGSD